MSITVTFPATMTVRCAKINQDVVLTVNEAAIKHWVKYGLKQDLNDGHASIKRDQFGTEREWHAAVGNHAAKWKAQREAGIVPGAGGLELTADELKMVLEMRAKAAKKPAA